MLGPGRPCRLGLLSLASHHERRDAEVAPGLFECWVVRKPEYATFQGVFHTFPELQEFNFRDVYTRHPDPNKADYWCSAGRSDDIIVLGNGEKIQPAEIESIINSHPEVKGCLVVSQLPRLSNKPLG